ncbi:MAG TPA: helix-turn-helix transcriptional regulator [Acidothermaceae bacterium]
MVDRKNLTVGEWEVQLGRQVRAARVARGIDQVALAARANVSLATLSNLERGKGSTLKTLVAVARALGRTEWLETFAPEITVSPMQMLRAKQQRGTTTTRVRAPRRMQRG